MGLDKNVEQNVGRWEVRYCAKIVRKHDVHIESMRTYSIFCSFTMYIRKLRACNSLEIFF